MSWHVTATFPGRDARSALEALRPEVLAQNPDGEDQFNAARDAAFAIIFTGAVGYWFEPDDRRYHVVMSGHANPGHEPREGYARDMVNVSVSQA